VTGRPDRRNFTPGRGTGVIGTEPLRMADSSVTQPNLSLVLERITDGFFALDATWRLAYINAEARKLLRAQSENVIGKHWLEAFPRARGRLFETEYLRAMREQQPVQFIEYSDTANRWFECKAYPSRDGISVYFRDVTARVEAQRELERTARRQQALIEFGRTALTGVPYEQLLVEAMELLRETLDVQTVEIGDYDRLSTSIALRRAIGSQGGLPAHELRPFAAHMCSAIHSGAAFICSDVRSETREPSLAGFAAHGVLSLLCVPIGTPQQPVGAIAAYDRHVRTFAPGDIRFMEAVAQTIAETATAAESNRRMAQVIESISDAFVAVDRDLRVTYVNERMARFWRRESSEMLGAPLAEFTAHFEDGGRALRFFEDALRKGAAVRFETLYRSRWFETRIYPFAGGVAAYVRDVTQDKDEHQRMLALNAELERRVTARTRQLELANEELESFSYSVSHDLRAPLRAIDGFSLALVEDYGKTLGPGARGYLDRVRRAAQRMSDLIDALLELARVARTEIVASEIDVSALATAVVEELRLQDPGRVVEVTIQPGLRAYGHRQLIGIVLHNLIANAWKFTRNRNPAKIEVGRSPGAEFYVRDNGAGFDMTYANKLFGAFQRLHSADEYEGTGIGLATVRRIVHRHGGTIRAEGAVDAGAVFSFTLPEVKEPIDETVHSPDRG
jgi:PAS domain S-box-containing protein